MIRKKALEIKEKVGMIKEKVREITRNEGLHVEEREDVN